MLIAFVFVVFLFTNDDDVEGSMFIVVSKSLFWNKHVTQYVQTRHSGMDCPHLVYMDVIFTSLQCYLGRAQICLEQTDIYPKDVRQG